MKTTETNFYQEYCFNCGKTNSVLLYGTLCEECEEYYKKIGSNK